MAADPTARDETYLLRLARSTIENALEKRPVVERPASLSPVVDQKRGCFVTLHKAGNLRGCIGTIEPVKPLILAVEENAVNAAFRDPRFPPVTLSELPDIHIEVSVLTVPRPLPFDDPGELKQRLVPKTHGVILTQGWRSATFLPQVWDQLPDTEMFLSHLCRKAGLGADCWKGKGIEVKTYEAYYFAE